MKLFVPIFMSAIIVVFQACNSTNGEQLKTIKPVDSDTIEVLNPHIDTLHSINFEVIRFDFNQSNELFRVFIQVDLKLLEDKDSIHDIICQLSEFYKLDTNSYLSFFTEKDFANYKDELFREDLLDEAHYEKWRNEYYAAEFEFSTRELTRYPASTNLDGRIVHLIIPPCY